MAIKMNMRSKEIGSGIYGKDVSHWGIARRGGIVAHPPCCALKNLSSSDLNIAVQRGQSILKGTLADGLDEFQNLAPEFKVLLANELLPLGMCFKEFNLGTAIAVGLTPSNFLVTAAMTTNMPSSAGSYYFFVEVLTDNPVGVSFTPVSANVVMSVVQNPDILNNGLGIGKETFIMKVVITGSNASSGSAIVFDGGDVVSGIAAGDVKVWLISEWTIDQVSAEF